MRVTVIGCGTARPEPESSGSGLLVDSGATSVLLDCGHGVVSRLQRRRDPRGLSAVVVGHLHADHYVDLIGLRYLFPWKPVDDSRLPVHLPPGGRERLARLAVAISERPSFFEDAFDVVDYDTSAELRVGDLTMRAVPGRHYIPAWGFEVVDSAGERLLYAGDTGPNDEVVTAARGADLLIAEATLAHAADDDSRRGHLTADEAIDIAMAAGVSRAVLVHYPKARRAHLADKCAVRGGVAVVGWPGMSIDVRPIARRPGASRSAQAPAGQAGASSAADLPAG
ncbi:MAG TPA: MBL fold metallo-hydrolase [Candidatus Limnocylindrales bacterium]|nr:MBL fold metallo-hydrolase [Candidatus Limnocylindrales bacterium]